MRIGFVGLGYAAGWLHAPAARQLAGAEMVGGVDESPERRRSWTDSGNGPSYESLSELLEQARPELVVIATPPGSHAELCVQSLAAGAHVLCEKPFVESLDDADAVLEVARAAGRIVAVNQEFRYMPIFAALADQLGRRDVGRPVFLHCTQFMDLAPWDEPVPWRAAMPDRTLFEGGVHIVDLVYMLIGRLPVSVVSTRSSGLEQGRVADAIHLVTLDFGDGLLAQITINRLCKAGTRYVDLRVDCEQASLRASYGGRALIQLGVKRGQRPGLRVEVGLEGLAWTERGLRRRVIARNPRHAAPRATAALYEDAIGAISAGRQLRTSGEEARQTLRIIEAAYRSAATGERVSLAP